MTLKMRITLRGERDSYFEALNSPAKEPMSREFPGGPVVKTLRFHCRGPGFGPWSGN